MNDDTILGATLGQLGQTVKQAAKQVVKIPEEMAKDVGGQVGSAKQNPSEKQNTSENKGLGNKSQWESDEERVKFLRDLYGSSEKNSSEEEKLADKSPEEQKKLLELRNQLHKQNYYDPTFNPPQKQEERPAEKVENEKKVEMQDLQQKNAEKPPPLAVVREQNKTEMFRGAAG